jgi:hypothetical protein
MYSVDWKDAGCDGTAFLPSKEALRNWWGEFHGREIVECRKDGVPISFVDEILVNDLREGRCVVMTIHMSSLPKTLPKGMVFVDTKADDERNGWDPPGI